MKKLVLGTVLLSFSIPSAGIALTQYADGKPLFVPPQKCWYVDGSVNDRYGYAQSIEVISYGPVSALEECLRAMAPIVPKQVVVETVRG